MISLPLYLQHLQILAREKRKKVNAKKCNFLTFLLNCIWMIIDFFNMKG